MDGVLKVIGDIAVADSMSYWLVGALTALVFVIMRAMLPVKSLSFVFAPALFWGGLCGIHTFSVLGISLMADKSANGIISATVGMVAALLLTIVLVRLVGAIFRIRTPLTRTNDMAHLQPRRVRIQAAGGPSPP